MPTPVLSDTLAQGILVGAVAEFSPADSDSSDKNFIFRYTVTISNHSKSPAQLLSRHWIIIDANGQREDVRGPGVIGQTPRILPGDEFKYQSYCPLRTEWGTMEGSYEMKRDDGERFTVAVDRFYLRKP